MTLINDVKFRFPHHLKNVSILSLIKRILIIVRIKKNLILLHTNSLAYCPNTSNVNIVNLTFTITYNSNRFIKTLREKFMKLIEQIFANYVDDRFLTNFGGDKRGNKRLAASRSYFNNSSIIFVNDIENFRLIGVWL